MIVFALLGVWLLALAFFYRWMAHEQIKHKAEMDAADRHFAQYDWAAPINAEGPGTYYVLAVFHAVCGVGLIAAGLVSAL